MKRLPMATPGEILNEEFIKAYGISAYKLAKDTGLSQTRISQIINGKRSITGETAERLARYFDTSVEFWLNIQMRYDLYTLTNNPSPDIRKIPTLKSLLAPARKASKTRTASSQISHTPNLRPA